MTHKYETLYDEVMHRLVVLSEYKIKCLTYTTDFEHAIMNSCEYQFGSKSTHNGQHIGCFFHLKQANIKYLTEKCGLTWESRTLREAVSSRERPSWGGLDILTHVPINEIVEIGIPYCKAYLELGMKPSEKPAWDKYWSYFEKEWIPTMKSWNINNDDGTTKETRTNCAIENYNRDFNGLFGNGRTPTLIEFVEIVKEESKRWFQNVTDMIRGTYQVPPHIELQIPPLPQEYIDFKEEHGALKPSARRKKSKPN
jgi:hypothetical protein